MDWTHGWRNASTSWEWVLGSCCTPTKQSTISSTMSLGHDSINRYKARLVTKGYAQTHGINYEETLVLVAKMTTIWIILILVTAKGWASPLDGCEKCVPPRRVGGGDVHGTTTRLQVKFTFECRMPTQEAPLRWALRYVNGTMDSGMFYKGWMLASEDQSM